MAKLTVTHLVDDDGLAALQQPRDDFVLEEPQDDGSFGLGGGPFIRYHRALTVDSSSDGPASTSRHRVTERTEFRLDIPIWRPLITPLVWWELRRKTRRSDRMPFWSPPNRIDSITARTLCYLAVLAIISGYLGSLLSQTIAFAGAEFGASDSDQSAMAGWVRLGVPIAFVVASLGDRKGRRTVLLGAATAGCLLAAITALTPTFWGYGVSQAIARGMSAALGLMIGIAAAEEIPDGSRAYVASILTMAGGLGSGMVVWFVPLTDLDDRAWRLLFLLPLLALLPLWWMRTRLPETRRFARMLEKSKTEDGVLEKPESWRSLLGRRFLLLGFAAFLLAAFAAPASTLQTTFLTEQRGFSGTSVTLFKTFTSTPVGIGLLIAGRLADTKGRKVVGAFGLIAGVLFTALEFTDSGWRLWMWGLLGTVIGAAAVPALGVYGPEMFGTRSRSRANAALVVVATAGSAVGLFFASWSLDRNSFGVTFAILAIAPISVAIVLLLFFPETANRSLEDLNPQDA